VFTVCGSCSQSSRESRAADRPDGRCRAGPTARSPGYPSNSVIALIRSGECGVDQDGDQRQRNQICVRTRTPEFREKRDTARRAALESKTAPGRIRTCDLRFRKPLLCPAELRALGGIIRAAGGTYERCSLPSFTGSRGGFAEGLRVLGCTAYSGRRCRVCGRSRNTDLARKMRSGQVACRCGEPL
jgi:hypothetical protein